MTHPDDPMLAGAADLLHELPANVLIGPPLDGYLTGLLVLRERVLMDEWLVGLFSERQDMFRLAERPHLLTAYLRHVYQRYGDILDGLRRDPQAWRPTFDGAAPGGWRPWFTGFRLAVGIDRWDWVPTGDGTPEDEARRVIVGYIACYAGHDSAEVEECRHDRATLEEDFERLIPESIRTMFAARQGHRAYSERSDLPGELVAMLRPHARGAMARALATEDVAVEDDGEDLPRLPVVLGPKVGRNEPCPCGSGKKFKKCCGA